MIDHRAALLGIIDSFLRGERSFEEFSTDYSWCFIDEIPEMELTPEIADQYGAVHEKAEWTTAYPTPEERGYGWMDIDEFTIWLRRYRESLEGAP